jgi:hypothetical protein
MMKSGAFSSKSGGSSASSSGNKQTPRPSSAPAARKATPQSKKVKQGSNHIETVMPVPNKPLAIQEKCFLDSGKARLSW